MKKLGATIFLLLLCVSCHAQRVPSKTMQTITLSGNAVISENKLVIEYQFANNGNAPIYLFDLIPEFKPDGNEVINHNLAYVIVEEPKTLRVVRAALRIPRDRDVYIQEFPYVRAVKPGETAIGKIVLPIPVAEYNPYYESAEKPEDERETVCDTVRLLIGWNELLSGMELSDDEVDGEKIQKIRGGWNGTYQHLAEQIFKIEVKAKVRRDAFDRQMPLQ